VGLAVNSVFHFPFWCSKINFRNASWFSNPPLVGVGKVASGKTTVILIWFSSSELPVRFGSISLLKEVLDIAYEY
jgi:hypothetical protein